jgi:hypothetical protein
MSFRAQQADDRQHAANLRKLAALKAAYRRSKNADRLALCRHQALMRKADLIWFAPRGQNGRSMNSALLARHWSARGMAGQPAEVPAR